MVVEIMVPKYQRLSSLLFPGFSKKNSRVYVASMPEKKAKKIKKKAQKKGYSCKIFDESCVRSTSYRYQFVSRTPTVFGKYRCVYCGKRIKPKDMRVDHVIPIAAVQESKRARRLLHGKNVNDLTNLVPACEVCNAEKGDSFSVIWRIRAAIGKHAWYWRTRRICILSLVLLALVLAAAYCFPETAAAVLQKLGDLETRLHAYITLVE